MITDENLNNLIELAKISANDQEKASLKTDVTQILSYVSQIEMVETSEEDLLPDLINVMRLDEKPHQSSRFTNDLLNQAPDVEDGYIKVPKII